MNRKARGYVSALLLVLFSALFVPPTGYAELTETEVSESLICYVCPGEPLNVGRCSGGDQMRTVISSMLDEGKSKQEILDHFVAQFGESILTTVPKKGFNWFAYTGPFIALLVGFPLAIFLIRRWTAAGRAGTAEQAATGEAPLLDEQARLRIEKELSELDEED
jgi:cytochrome c-type biogenesis protein CcmH